MPDFGPTGGPGGSPFEEMAPQGTGIAQLIIRSGGPRNVLIAIQALYVNVTTGQVTLGDRHGGGGGEQDFITLNAGEFFTQISGRTGQFVDSLTVETSLPRRFGRFGGLGGTSSLSERNQNWQASCVINYGHDPKI
jgi:hypothetical protein